MVVGNGRNDIGIFEWASAVGSRDGPRLPKKWMMPRTSRTAHVEDDCPTAAVLTLLDQTETVASKE